MRRQRTRRGRLTAGGCVVWCVAWGGGGNWRQDIELAKYKTALTHPNTLVQQAACNTFTALARKSQQNADAVLGASILPEVSAQLLAVKPGPKEATLRLINTLVVSSVDVCDRYHTPLRRASA